MHINLGRQLCKIEVINWRVDNVPLPSSEMQSLIRLLYATYTKDVSDYYSFDWASSSNFQEKASPYTDTFNRNSTTQKLLFSMLGINININCITRLKVHISITVKKYSPLLGVTIEK